MRGDAYTYQGCGAHRTRPRSSQLQRARGARRARGSCGRTSSISSVGCRLCGANAWMARGFVCVCVCVRACDLRERSLTHRTSLPTQAHYLLPTSTHTLAPKKWRERERERETLAHTHTHRHTRWCWHSPWIRKDKQHRVGAHTRTHTHTPHSLSRPLSGSCVCTFLVYFTDSARERWGERPHTL